MKTGKKIAVLLVVFLAAAVVYFMWPAGRKEENGTVVRYTAMEEATLPVVYPQMLERDMAPLFGHREEKAVTAARDSLLVLPEDRKLGIRVDEADEVMSLGYEIRSLDMENLIERTELTDWKREGGDIQTMLPIQNLLNAETEYLLGIRAGLKDGSEAWYYARIIETDSANVAEMLTLAEQYSEKTFQYESAQDLTMYMESSPTADNSSFGVVTLKNSFTQMTWGTLGVERISEPRMTLKELSGNLANVELEYEVTRTDEDAGVENYTVTENFTMKWTNQRIYMMDYERRMNQLFTGAGELYSGKRITLGISDGDDLYAKKSADGRYMAFVNNGELWFYDSKECDSVCVFAFGSAGGEGLSDLRASNDRHGVEILNVSENGDIEFLVYGYMNRGNHEGWTGVAYHHYIAESNTLEEEFFIPASEPYEELKTDLELLSYKGENGSLYLYMNGTVYGIDLTSHEYVVVAYGLNEDRFAVSGDRTRLAWQENGGLYDSASIYVMDLNTGSKTQIREGKDNAYRILGFVGSDLVYGVGKSGDYIMSNGRVMGLYLNSLEIVDKDMNSAMHYEKSGRYIRDVQVDESRIHITLVNEKNGGFFGSVSDDTLVCNVEALPGRMDDIGWYASNEKGRVYFVQLTRDVPSGQRIRSTAPKKLVTDENNMITPEKADADDTMRFYAYGRGRCLGVYTKFADAAQAAYDCMGFVSVGKNDPIWIRGNKSGAYFIRDVQGIARSMERYRAEFTGESLQTEECLLLDASGTALNQILYFVGENHPVLVNIGEGRYQYLTGYDQGHVRVWDPLTGESDTLSLDTASARFEKLGNDFICCIYGE